MTPSVRTPLLSPEKGHSINGGNDDSSVYPAAFRSNNSREGESMVSYYDDDQPEDADAPLLVESNRNVNSGMVTPPMILAAPRVPFAPHASSPMSSRFKFYEKVERAHSNLGLSLNLEVPTHVIARYMTLNPIVSFISERGDGLQSSTTTVLSTWATTCGMSLLAFPWAIANAGFFAGLLATAVMGAIACYTAYLVLRHTPKNSEFSDALRTHTGKIGENLGAGSSLLVFSGALIGIMTLLTSAMLSIVEYVFHATGHGGVGPWYVHSRAVVSASLSVILFPFMIKKDADIFLKLNVAGPFCMSFLIVFLMYEGFSSELPVGLNAMNDYLPTSFPGTAHIAGLLMMSLFNHNAIVTLFSRQRNPDNNGRDVSFAFALIVITYAFIGGLGALAWGPGITQNALDFFSNTLLLPTLARLCLSFQMLTLAPLILYIIRVNISTFWKGTVYPGAKPTVIIAFVWLSCAATMAVVYPQFGTILRYTGGVCGFVYVFFLPVWVHWNACRVQRPLSPLFKIAHSITVSIGLVSMIFQVI